MHNKLKNKRAIKIAIKSLRYPNYKINNKTVNGIYYYLKTLCKNWLKYNIYCKIQYILCT